MLWDYEKKVESWNAPKPSIWHHIVSLRRGQEIQCVRWKHQKLSSPEN